jgi:GntR family transcriptional regulator, rspAB operon transcriptional repressor
MSDTPTNPRAPRNARKTEQTLDARLSETLIREIIDGRHPPGAWLREQEIAARHGVSRASVREALRNVAYAGFVQIQPWRGAQVMSLPLQELLEVFVHLEGLYAQCARLAAEAGPEITPLLIDLLEQMERSVAEGAPREGLYTLSFRFGRAIARHSGSQLAYRQLVQVGNLALWQQRLRVPGTVRSEAQSLCAHRILASAIEAGQPEIAAEAARLVVMITRRELSASVAAAAPERSGRRKGRAKPA